ncbi:hypothetical protein Tco_1167234 [Tanacetum coccineum]
MLSCPRLKGSTLKQSTAEDNNIQKGYTQLPQARFPLFLNYESVGLLRIKKTEQWSSGKERMWLLEDSLKSLHGYDAEHVHFGQDGLMDLTENKVRVAPYLSIVVKSEYWKVTFIGDETLSDSNMETSNEKRSYKAVPPPTDWLDSDDEGLMFQKVKRKTVFNTEDSEESLKTVTKQSKRDAIYMKETFQTTKLINLREPRVQGQQDQFGTTSKRREHSNLARNFKEPQQRRSLFLSADYKDGLINHRIQVTPPSSRIFYHKDLLIDHKEPKTLLTIDLGSKERKSVGSQADSVNRGNGSYTLKQFEYGSPGRGSQGTMLSWTLVLEVMYDRSKDKLLILKSSQRLTEDEAVPMDTEDWGTSLQKYQQVGVNSTAASCKKIEERTVREPLELLTYGFVVDLFQWETQPMPPVESNCCKDVKLSSEVQALRLMSLGRYWNTPTDFYDDELQTDGVSLQYSFDAEEGGVADLQQLDFYHDVTSTPYT